MVSSILTTKTGPSVPSRHDNELYVGSVNIPLIKSLDEVGRNADPTTAKERIEAMTAKVLFINHSL